MRRLAAPAARSILGRISMTPGVATLTRRRLASTVNVAFVHYIGPRVPHVDAFYTGTDAAWLERTLDRLARWFVWAPLSDVVEGARAGPDGREPLALAFDDGFAMSEGVLDVLARHRVSATVFVITGCVDNCNLMWRNKISAVLASVPGSLAVDAYRGLAEAHGLQPVRRPGEVLRVSRNWPMAGKDELADELWARCSMPRLDHYMDQHQPYLTWDGLRACIDAGHAVGLHTRTHPFCARLSAEEVDVEIIAPATELRGKLALENMPLSYPFGSRLPAELEQRLADDGVVTATFGVGGFCPRGTPPHRLERAALESDMEWQVFGRSLFKPLR